MVEINEVIEIVGIGSLITCISSMERNKMILFQFQLVDAKSICESIISQYYTRDESWCVVGFDEKDLLVVHLPST